MQYKSSKHNSVAQKLSKNCSLLLSCKFALVLRQLELNLYIKPLSELLDTESNCGMLIKYFVFEIKSLSRGRKRITRRIERS